VSAAPALTRDDVVGRLRAAGCVFAEEEAELLLAEAGTPDRLGALVVRRVAGEPLEHVLGWAEFCGLRVAVDPGVFVPRRRTEFLVREAARLARDAVGPVVVDLCCGSGALGLALASMLGAVRLFAADVDPAAVRCALRNLDPIGGQVFEGDLFDPLPRSLRGSAVVLLANVPYVPTAEIALMPAEARDHEPRPALDGGDDGLDVLRRVAAEAGDWLAPGGRLFTEAGEEQGPVAAAILADAGLVPTVLTDPDEPASVVVGTRPA
jgi:release factor glutamine methyltransferase